MSASPMSPAAPPGAVYAHFPFCRSRCHYCDFAVSRRENPPVGTWLDAMGKELEWSFAREGWSRPVAIETLFIGGGTPSLMGGWGVERLAEVMSSWFVWGDDLEWTIEANPASIDEATSRRWREAGVNRISIGVQSLSDAALAWLGRLHDSRAAVAALRTALETGFRSVSADLLFGLPQTVSRAWPEEVEEILSLGVPHLSVYGLSAEPRTPLGREVRRGAVRMPGEDRYAEEYLAAVSALAEAGFEHYEVSNFARPGHECRHNWHYWDGSHYLGLGPSAHSYVGGRRRWNVRAWEAYRRAIEGGILPCEESERPSGEALRLERLWLQLRTRRGIPVDEWPDVAGGGDGAVRSWLAAGWAVREEGRLRLTPTGWLRLDELVLAFAERPGAGGVTDRRRGDAERCRPKP